MTASGSSAPVQPGRSTPAAGRFALGDPARWPLVMGVINVTPDSFSDGGLHFDTDRAVEAALAMHAAGAAIVDVGGESTRPGADPVPLEEELRRVVPVVRGIRSASPVPVSVDTRNAAVARAALEAGADVVNDVSALRHDPDMARVVREAGVPVVLMHMRGEPKTMQEGIRFDELIGEIREDLTRWRDLAIERGIEPSRIMVDPGLGFGKTFEHNVEILARVGELRELGPVVIGASRKGFIGRLTGREGGRARMAGSLAAVAAAALGGAALVRVHDVAETVDFLEVLRPIMGASR
ncbi:MAG TPA: dihydropteroate synthase [Thermoanaerobaculia bacterium]|nr:dihydropteroate synthase [Thermoanaerobaculia bacterium]